MGLSIEAVRLLTENIDPQTVSNLDTLLSRVCLNLTKSDDDSALLITDTDGNPNRVVISTTQFLSGFLLDHKPQQPPAESELDLAENNSELKVLNRDHLLDLIRKLEETHIKELFAHQGIDLQNLVDILRKHKLEPRIEFIGENPFIYFWNKKYVAAHLKNDKSVFGLIFRRDDETESQHHQRKYYLKRKSRKRIVDDKAAIWTITPDNVEELLAQLDENQMDVYDQVFFDNQALTESKEAVDSILGILNPLLNPQGIKAIAAEQIIAPLVSDDNVPKPPFPLVDILFVRDDEEKGMKIEPIAIWGWDAKSRRKNTTNFQKPIVYQNVIGAIVVPPTTGLEERKKLAITAAKQLRANCAVSGNPLVLVVDEHLTSQWQKSGQVLPTEDQIAKTAELPVKKQLDYGPNIWQQFPLTTADVFLYLPQNQYIGGPHITLRLSSAEKENARLYEALFIDHGLIYSTIPSWLRQTLGSPPKQGILKFLQNGTFDTIKRVYDLYYLEEAVSPKLIESVCQLTGLSATKPGFYSVEEFVALELFHRLSADGFTDLLIKKNSHQLVEFRRSGKLTRLISWLDTRLKLLYAQKTYIVGNVMSHAHSDHTGISAFMRAEIDRISSDMTRALLLANHKLADSWFLQEMMVRKLRDYAPQKPLPIIEYPHLSLQHGQTIQVSQHIFVTGYETNHSIPGAMSLVVEVKGKNKMHYVLAYVGDSRGSLAGRNSFFQDLQENHPPADLLLLEGTNAPIKIDDPKEHLNEEDVKKNFIELIVQAKQDGALLAVDLIRDNYDRLNNIIDAALAKGQTVVISPKIVQKCQSLHLIMNGSLSNHIRLPDFNHPAIKIWQPDRKTPRTTQENRIFEQYGSESQDAVSTNPGNVVLIRDANEPPYDLEAIVGEIFWVRSTSQHLDSAGAYYYQKIKELAARNGWRLFTDGFHASGHAQHYEASDPRSAGTLMEQFNQHPHAKQVAVVHTNDQIPLLKTMKTYPNLAKVPTLHFTKPPLHKPPYGVVRLGQK